VQGNFIGTDITGEMSTRTPRSQAMSSAMPQAYPLGMSRPRTPLAAPPPGAQRISGNIVGVVIRWRQPELGAGQPYRHRQDGAKALEQDAVWRSAATTTRSEGLLGRHPGVRAPERAT